MQKCKYFILTTLVVFLLFLLIGCGVSGGKITASQLLKQYPEADIIQYEGSIYSNITHAEWFAEERDNYSKDENLGEISRQTTNRHTFRNYYATTVPVGAKLYSSKQHEEDSNDQGEYTGIIIVEYDEEILFYREALHP